MPGKCFGTRGGAIAQRKLAGCGVEQGGDDARRGAAGPDDQYPSIGQGKATVLYQIVNEASAVGVVGADTPVRQPRQCIRGAASPCVAVGFVGKLEGSRLVRYGNVEALAGAREKLAHARGEGVGGGIDQLVFKRNVRLLGKGPVNLRRTTVPDRVANDSTAGRGHSRNQVAASRA